VLDYRQEGRAQSLTFKDFFPYHILTVICSSVSYAIFMVIIEPSYRAIIACFIIPFVTLIPYSIAAVPLQFLLNKCPKRFNIFYLLIYCVVAIVFLYVFYKLEGGWPTPIFNPRRMIVWAIGAGIIYWFWDSVIMQKYEYPYY